MRDVIKNGLFKTEDWLSVWLGFLIIVLVLVGVRPQMPTFKWATEGEFTTTVTGSKPAVDWFALAFTSIGLETRFIELFKMGGGRPAIAFIGAQTFNVIWTLILAYLLFGGFIFKVPVIQ